MILLGDGHKAAPGLRAVFADEDHHWISLFDSGRGVWETVRAKDCPLYVRNIAWEHRSRTMTPKQTVVNGGAIYFHPSDERAPELVDKLKLPNPDFAQAMRMRDKGKRCPLPLPYISACFNLPLSHAWADGVMAPRFAPVMGFNLDFVDRRTEGRSIEANLGDDYWLRDYQQDAVDSALRNGSGVLVAPCGAGKTSIGIGIVAAVRQRTLILVHTKDLMQQWQERIEEWLPQLSMGFIGGGRTYQEGGDIVVATVQTLMNMQWQELYDLGKQFGLVILDEAHHCPAASFSWVMTAMPAKLRFGLTATPTREDGLTDFMWWTFGPKIWEISHRSLQHNGLIVVPSYHFVATCWSPEDPDDEYQSIITEMTMDEERNRGIVQLAHRCAASDRKVLLLSGRVGHCEQLHEELQAQGVSSVLLLGKMSPKKRTAALEGMRAGQYEVCISTTVADEGLDLPLLDTLIMCTPTKAQGKVEQRIGRLMRPHPGKEECTVYDLVDDWGPFFHSARSRRSLYRILCMPREPFSLSTCSFTNYDRL